MRDRAHPLAVLAWFVLVAGGLGLTLLVGVLRPGWFVAAFVLGFVTWMGGFTGSFVHERWLVALPVAAALALACIGAVAHGGDRVLEEGERVEVVVTDHRQSGSSHTYDLDRTDGRPLGEPLVWAGGDGPDGIEVGSRVEVLVDPTGDVDLELARDVDAEQSLEMATWGGGFAGLLMLLGWLPRRPAGGAPSPPWY